MDEAVSSGGDKMEVQMNKNEERTNSSVVRWEKFLPRMMVRVLLVESDDSTRQIISALLRKCHYKVAAVADGLRAWEVLKERSRNIDLILTEVDLPSISGFALLTLITEDDICRNIPVIMMSSHDSIGTVHKCMMRGASDFLMKPIRINELKNLWQHVWRRQSCQPAMGYGLVPQVDSAAPMKVDEATAENNAVSDRSSGSKALLPREEECFKKGSDAQSSCTNTSLEARSAYAEEESQGLSGTNKLKPQDSEGLGKNLCAYIVADEDVCEGEYTIIQEGEVVEQNHLVIANDLGSQASERTTTRAESSREAIDLIGAFDSKVSDNGSWLNNRPIVLESSGPNLSWSGFQLNGFESNTNRNNGLIHSNASAFSRYKNKESQMMPIESTMNSVEHYSVHVHANHSENNGGSSYNRNTISLPIHHRREPYDQHRPYPIPIGTRDVNYLQHFTGDHSIFHEERFVCIDESRKQEQKEENVDKKTSLSPPTDPSGSDSFCNGSMSHTMNWPGRVCVSNGNMNGSVLPTTCVLETGNADERSFPSLCSNQREAALMKFRLKRKERCYEKKVRYESRKKLADQRPRVKGQFVRRIPPDPPPNPEVDYASVRG